MSDPEQLLDAERPWPGLASYSEANRDFFKGRDRQAEELLRLVERETIVWLYGRSGLGKTSLLQAGLFPRLRLAGYLPVSLRLALDEDATGLHEQLAAALVRQAELHKVETPAWDGSGSLWEYFYTRDGEFWSADDQPVTPVLVFDQLEEIFTLGRETPERRRRCEAFLKELGEVAENRRPEDLRRRIEEDPALAARFDARRPPPKILLSFREDYLADFDDLHEFLRGRTSNRLRLLSLTGATAKEAILAASPDKLEPAVAERIIRFVDSRQKPLTHLEIEPALLSLVCQKLNEKRISRKEDRIEANLIADGSAEAILEEFYQGAFVGLDPRVRDFVEDRLLTASGHRDSCALDNALVAAPGVDEQALEKLTARRLLRREDRDGQVRIELIHDRLAPVVLASRDSRREAEKRRAARRRQRRIVVAFLLVGIALATFFVVTLRLARITSRQASLVLVDYAQRALKEGQNERAARFAILAAREGALEVAEPAAVPTLQAAAQASNLALELRGHSRELQGVRVSPDGTMIVSWDSSGLMLLRDAETGHELLGSRPLSFVSAAAFDQAGRRLLWWGDEGVGHVLDLSSGLDLILSPARWKITAAQFDSIGDRILSWGGDTLQVWDATSGRELSSIHHESVVQGAIIDSTGARVLSWDQDGYIKSWDSLTGRVVVTSRRGGQFFGAMFDSSGERVLSWDIDRGAYIWDPLTGRDLALAQHEAMVLGAQFDRTGERVVSWQADGVVRVWDAWTGRTLASTRFKDWVGGSVFDLSGKRVLSWGSDGFARVWDASTGRDLAATRHLGGVSGAIFAGSGNAVLSWGRDGRALLWDAATGTTLSTSVHPKPVWGAAAPGLGERQMYSWDESGLIRRWLFQTMDLGSAKIISLAKDSPRLLTADDQSFRIWDSDSGKQLAEVQEPQLAGAELDTSGQRCLAWSNKRVRIFDSSSCREIGSIVADGVIRHAAFDFAGKRVVAYAGHRVTIWNAASGGRSVNFDHLDEVTGADFDPGGSRLLTWGSDGKVRIWNSETGNELLTLAPEAGALSATFDHQGKWILTRGNWGVQVWDSTTGSRLGSARHRTSQLGAIFDPADSRVASWNLSQTFNGDGHLRIWRPQTGEVDRFVQIGWVEGAEFNASGTRLLLREIDALLLMDVSNGVKSYLSGSTLTTMDATFDHGGDRVVGWGWQGVKLWDTATGTELATPTARPVKLALIDSSGARMVLQFEGGRTEIRDVSWTIPRSSNRALIEDVCRDKLRGPDTLLGQTFVNGNSQKITFDSVRRISRDDSEFASLVRDRIGEDVCSPPSFWDRFLEPLFRFLAN